MPCGVAWQRDAATCFLLRSPTRRLLTHFYGQRDGGPAARVAALALRRAPP